MRASGRFLLAVFGPLVATPAVAATVIAGPAQVIDGDSLSVSGISIRLFGIDALEGRQTCTRNGQVWACGEETTSQLRALIGDSPVRCEGVGFDNHGRTLAICHAGPVELNRAMASAGWATAFRKYSTLYVDAEEQAKERRLGALSNGWPALSPADMRRG